MSSEHEHKPHPTRRTSRAGLATLAPVARWERVRVVVQEEARDAAPHLTIGVCAGTETVVFEFTQSVWQFST